MTEVEFRYWCTKHQMKNWAVDGPYPDCEVVLATCCCPAGSYDRGSPHESYCLLTLVAT